MTSSEPTKNHEVNEPKDKAGGAEKSAAKIPDVEFGAEIDSKASSEEPMTDEAAKEDFEGKAKEWENKFLYLSAEFDNFRKRMQKEKSDFFKYGHEDFLREQLMVQDNFIRAIEAAKQSNPEQGTSSAQMVEGLEMIMWQFMEAMKHQGVTTIEAVGQKFDPTVHEAVGQEEVNDKEPNVVLREELKGFMLHDRVLRASRVVISKKKD